MDKQVETGHGPCVPCNDAPPILLRWWTETKGSKVYVHGERICGSFTCPKCNLEWPLVQAVEEWTSLGRKTKDGKSIMDAMEWGLGVGECTDCRLAVAEGFDEDYVIDLT